jgi:hypothetical protein
MIREEPREFGIFMVAQPFGAFVAYTFPEKRSHVIIPLPSCTEPLWWLSDHLLMGSYLNWLASFGGSISNAWDIG